MSAYYPRKTSVLLLSFIQFSERFSYWGIRSFIILYTTSSEGFNWEPDDSFYYYNIMFLLMAIIPFPVGLFTDFTLKQKNGLLLGGLMALIGYTSLLTHNETIFWCSFIAIIIGTSLVRVNLTVLLGRLFHKSERKRDLGFIIHYYIADVAGLLSGITIGYVALNYNYGWNYGFIATSLVTLTYLLLFFFIRNKLEIKEENLDFSKKYNPTSPHLDYLILDAKDLDNDAMINVPESDHKKHKRYPFFLILILIIVLSLHQQLGEIISMYTNFNTLENTRDITYFDIYFGPGISFIIGILFFIIGYVKGLGSSLTKITYSFLFIGVSFLFLYTNEVPLEENQLALLAIPLITISIADILISPIILSYITRLSDTRYSSTIVGGYIGIIYAVGILLNKLFLIRNANQLLIPSILVAFGLFFVLLFFRKSLLNLSNGLD